MLGGAQLPQLESNLRRTLSCELVLVSTSISSVSIITSSSMCIHIIIMCSSSSSSMTTITNMFVDNHQWRPRRCGGKLGARGGLGMSVSRTPLEQPKIIDSIHAHSCHILPFRPIL